jgi:hypothetical protein
MAELLSQYIIVAPLEFWLSFSNILRNNTAWQA